MSKIELKGLEELNKELSKIVKPFGINEMTNAEDFSWVRDLNILTYTLETGTFHDEWFEEFIKERFDYEGNIFMMTIFHEIGHRMTDEEIGTRLGDYCDKEKERISKEILETDVTREREKALNWQYFYLPDEFTATAWAVDFMKKHPKKVEKMWKKFEKAFHNYYEKNEVTDDE